MTPTSARHRWTPNRCLDTYRDFARLLTCASRAPCLAPKWNQWLVAE
jgi:hypothetical protein